MSYLRKLKIQLVKGEYKNPVQGQVKEPKQVYEIFRKIKDYSQETLIGIYLTENLEVNVYDVLSVGGESTALVLPHEIFGHVLIARSKFFILIHNHPKGNPQPSAEDKEVIEALREGAGALRISFLDFIIVGENSYWSMFEEMDGGEYGLGSAF